MSLVFIFNLLYGYINIKFVDLIIEDILELNSCETSENAIVSITANKTT